VVHLPWRRLRGHLDDVRAAARGRERHWLDELRVYLLRTVPLREPSDRDRAEVVVVDVVVGDVPVGDVDVVRVAPIALGRPRRPRIWAWWAAR